MIVLPMWKLRRELLATYDQAVAFFIHLFFPFFRLKRRLFPVADCQVVEGGQSISKRVIVYLIFPGDEDLTDRLDAIDFLVAQNSSVVCVVNGRLSPAWLNKFSARCAYVLIRGNSGYDFGGYQAGVLFLNRLGCEIDHLHIINDSVLMPVVDNVKVIFDIESKATTGFGGAASLYLTGGANFSDLALHQSLLVLSYWLYFSGATVKSRCFWSYWTNYVPSSSKVLTVRYGERGLSMHMAKNGYCASTLYNIESVKVILLNASSDDLLNILRYASFTDLEFVRKCDLIIKEYQPSEGWSVRAIEFILEVAGRRNFLHSFCYLVYEMLDVPFIKKTRIKLPHIMRQKYISAVQDGVMRKPCDSMWSRLLKINQ